ALASNPKTHIAIVRTMVLCRASPTLSSAALCAAALLDNSHQGAQPSHVLLFKPLIDGNLGDRLLPTLSHDFVHGLTFRRWRFKPLHCHWMKRALDSFKGAFPVWGQVSHLRSYPSRVPRRYRQWARCSLRTIERSARSVSRRIALTIVSNPIALLISCS